MFTHYISIMFVTGRYDERCAHPQTNDSGPLVYVRFFSRLASYYPLHHSLTLYHPFFTSIGSTRLITFTRKTDLTMQLSGMGSLNPLLTTKDVKL